MTRVVVIDPRKRLAEVMAERLRADATAEAVVAAPGDPACDDRIGEGFDVVVYHPPEERCRAAVPCLAHARRVLERCAAASVRRVVLLSSATVYGPHYHNPGLMAEDRLARRHGENRIARRWHELEELAGQVLVGAPTRLTILRPAVVPLAEEYGPLGGLFHGWIKVRAAGHDPSIQLLSPQDLADAVARAVVSERAGVYNVAPAGVMPLRQALRLAGVWALPFCPMSQTAARAVLSRLKLSHPAARTDYLRYSWTISGEKIARELGFVPARASAEALHDGRVLETGRPPRRWPAFAGRRFDDFGYCPRYYGFVGATAGRFLERYYWRIETKGFGQIPAEGPAVLVGVHRGFMPFDGVMFTHQVARAAGRAPRFLIHPGLVKFPFLHDFMTKQGGVVACNANADYALKRGELLALFPEGIQGAFRLYRDAHTLARFLRDDYVKMAIRHGAPIVPFVTVGSAEIFPILAKIEWEWWKRYAEWPFIPITPTFPLAPVPLPSKWHTLVLEPVHVEREYPPEAAEDEGVVRAVGREVRGRMQAAMDWMRGRRRSIFFGSIFGEEVPAAVAAAPAGIAAAENG